MGTDQGRELQDLRWLAGMLNLGERTVYELARSGRLDRFGVQKIGGSWRVSVPAFRQAAHLDVEDRS